MAYRYISHLTAIEESARTKPKNIIFKVSESKSGWKDITYEEFWDDVTRLAVHWFKQLDRSVTNVERNRNVVGLWMIGDTYTDVIHMFSLQRAGYILRLMRHNMQDIDLIQRQLEELGVQVVVCDTECGHEWEQLQEAGIKVVPFLTHEKIVEFARKSSSLDLSVLPPLDGDGDDTLLITQSSGSTSGRPKAIPLTRRWIDATAQKFQIAEQRAPVAIRSGSFCFAAQICRSLQTFLYADCIVFKSSPKIGWDAHELASIITNCGVTNAVFFPHLVDSILEQAKTSHLLAEALRTLKSMTFMGGPLGERAFENAKELGIKIACGFGSTEVGPTMSFEPVLSGESPLKFCRQFDYEFVPYKDGNGDSTNLHELVVLPTSPDCPVLALRNPADGKYYTNDLFEIVEGGYVFRGRKNDTFLLKDTALCLDLKYIEDQIAYLCHDLISSFVVVGQGRPSPALLVEPRKQSNATTASTGTFRRIISTRLETLNSSVGYLRERIKPEYIIILPQGSLPVSPGKGAVVRSKAESMFKEMLDEMYGGRSI